MNHELITNHSINFNGYLSSRENPVTPCMLEKRDFECCVRSLQLPSECGAATLVLISPNYLLLNETGKILKVSQNFATKDSYEIFDQEVYYLTWPCNQQQIHQLFFNYTDRGYIWSSGLKINMVTPGEFYLKIGSLEKSSPKIL